MKGGHVPFFCDHLTVRIEASIVWKTFQPNESSNSTTSLDRNNFKLCDPNFPLGSGKMTDSTYCYLHMTSARISAMDFFDELDGRSIVGKVDEDEIEIPFGAMPPDPDDGDNLPSHIHPSFPYGNPFKDVHLSSAAFPTNPYSTRARFEDAEFEGVGLKSKRRWKDLGLDMLLPPDPIKDEEEKARAARNSVHTSSRRQAEGSSEQSALQDETHDEDEDEDEEEDLDGEDEDSDDEEADNTIDYDLSQASPSPPA